MKTYTLFVGEMNPYGRNPRYALFPYPENSAGGRLCFNILGFDRSEYVKRFMRMNLCYGRWSMPNARLHASEIVGVANRSAVSVIVLLGAKVSKAFGLEYEPFKNLTVEYEGIDYAANIVILPHPSGRCRIWNDKSSYAKARRCLISAGVDLRGSKFIEERRGESRARVGK